MSISEKLTQKRFQEILFHAYLKGEKSEDIKVAELIQEIIQEVLVTNK
ncbi:hypothetical protein [Bacillus sp. EB600]|nr:hypothetical protein [Bacillus sp. EB600]MCQ6278894.1 hypothetical protein [Bacillus sp. EB600]